MIDCDRIHLIEPLDVVDFQNFANHSYMIMSDSGGVQEEAPSLGKPVLVLRDTTERPEGIEAGTLRLVGTSEDKVFVSAKELLEDNDIYDQMSKASNPYGDGFASQRILDAIAYSFGLTNENLLSFKTKYSDILYRYQSTFLFNMDFNCLSDRIKHAVFKLLKFLVHKLPPIKQINHPNCFKRQIDKMTIIMANQM